MASGWSTSPSEEPSPLLQQCVDLDNLRRALEDVVANVGDDHGGALPRSIRALIDHPDQALTGLADQLVRGEYRPRPLAEVRIPKASGSARLLSVPSGVDRIVERAVLQVLTGVLEPHLGPHSFAYRPGVSVGDAVRTVALLRDEGFGWVAHTDVHDCFPSIDRARLRRSLDVLVAEPSLLALLDALLERPSITREGRRRWPPGLPQGSPLSPLFSNLVLAEFDDAVVRSGHPLVRYADDVLIFARDREGAMNALRDAADAIAALGLALGEDKTEVVDFATGFSFLGEDFNARYPGSDHRGVDAPDRRVLYVGLQGSYASVRGGRVVVTRERSEVLSVPSGHVGRIVSFGSVTLAPSLMSWALSSDVDVVLCSRRGSLLGTIAPPGSTSGSVRRQQLSVSDDVERRMHIARAVVEGKLYNQRVLLQRRMTPEVVDDLAGAIGEIRGYVSMVADAADPSQLLGLEGIGARRYFAALVSVLPPECGFRGRISRPPGDVVNAALGYGYAILVGECVTALAAAGLDAQIGVLHTERGSRVSLALDLAEEFRPLLVDTVVVELIRSRALGPQHGRPVEAGKGVLLTNEGRTLLVEALERRLLTRVHHLATGRKVTYRRAVHLQAQALKTAILEPRHQYRAMLWRV